MAYTRGMDGQYPADLNKRSEAPDTQAPAPSFAPARPPEDEDLYLPPSQRPKPKWRKTVVKAVKIFAIVLLVAAVTGGVYWKFFQGKKPTPTQPPAGATHTVQKANAYTDQTKSVSSANVGLTLTYPATWEINDETDKLTINSPIVLLTDTNGQQTNGKITLTIQPKGTMPSAFDGGGVISALESQKIKYTKPTPIQRAETYLTFVQYAESLTKGRLDAMFVTGDFGYDANQFVPKTDIAKLDPLIQVTFQKCDDDQCAKPANTSINAGMWADDVNFQKTITTMLKSIRVDE
jgi:hypothetical protein